MISVNLSVLEKISVLNAFGEVVPIQEMVVLAVDFSIARCPGSARNRIVGFLFIGESTTEGRFSRTRGSGDKEENSGATHKSEIGRISRI